MVYIDLNSVFHHFNVYICMQILRNWLEWNVSKHTNISDAAGLYLDQSEVIRVKAESLLWINLEMIMIKETRNSKQQSILIAPLESASWYEEEK